MALNKKLYLSPIILLMNIFIGNSVYAGNKHYTASFPDSSNRKQVTTVSSPLTKTNQKQRQRKTIVTTTTEGMESFVYSYMPQNSAHHQFEIYTTTANPIVTGLSAYLSAHPIQNIVDLDYLWIENSPPVILSDGAMEFPIFTLISFASQPEGLIQLTVQSAFINDENEPEINIILDQSHNIVQMSSPFASTTAIASPSPCYSPCSSPCPSLLGGARKQIPEVPVPMSLPGISLDILTAEEVAKLLNDSVCDSAVSFCSSLACTAESETSDLSDNDDNDEPFFVASSARDKNRHQRNHRDDDDDASGSGGGVISNHNGHSHYLQCHVYSSDSSHSEGSQRQVSSSSSTQDSMNLLTIITGNFSVLSPTLEKVPVNFWPSVRQLIPLSHSLRE